MEESTINCIALGIGVIALIIGVIAFVESVLAFKAHTKELRETTEVKRLEIKELHESTETKRQEIKIKMMHERRDLLNYLRELIVLPRNYPAYFMARRIVTIPFQLDDCQPFIDCDRNTTNQYYQTILNEFQSKRSDVQLYFPSQLAKYEAFLESAANTQGSIEFHQETGEIKCWNHEMEKKTFELFDMFLDAANNSIY